MFEIFVAIAFASFGGYLAHGLGRSSFGLGALCLFFGPFGILIVLVLEPRSLARRQHPWVRAWLVVSCAIGLALVGGIIGTVVAIGAIGADSVEIGTIFGEASGPTMGPAVGLLASGVAALWDGFAAMLGGALGAGAALTVSPFVALALEKKLSPKNSRPQQ